MLNLERADVYPVQVNSHGITQYYIMRYLKLNLVRAYMSPVQMEIPAFEFSSLTVLYTFVLATLLQTRNLVLIRLD